MPDSARRESVRAGVLEVAIERYGKPGGPPVVLLHGFPYDTRAYDRVAVLLADHGADVIVPYLRGYGPTRFMDPTTIRSGQQAALAHDLRDLITALNLRPSVLAGYDWGGRAACLVAMLWPELVRGLVTVDGYNIQDIQTAHIPADPETESKLWYQFYLHGDRGRRGLHEHRESFARLLWRQWSPTWDFDEATFQQSATSFSNNDFVDVVVHSYRHRYGLVAGDPSYQSTEDTIERLSPITVPTIIIDAICDGLGPPSSPGDHQKHFSNIVRHLSLPIGHNAPQEAPTEFAAAVAKLL